MLELVLLCTTLRVTVQIKWDNENIRDNFRINLLFPTILGAFQKHKRTNHKQQTVRP